MNASRARWPHLAAVVMLTLAALAALVFGVALWMSPKPDILGGATFSKLFTDRTGRPLRLTLAKDDRYRLFVPLEGIPAELVDATLMYEDRVFFHHVGVNPLAICRAVAHMALGGRRMGGSTLTMQVARLAENLETTTASGKLHQIWRALVFERHFTKKELLEAYFNLAPYGANIEGVGAAARIYFHKDASRLTLPESLALVSVPQHPAARNPLAAKGNALPEARKRLHEMWERNRPGDGAAFAKMRLQVYSPREFPWEAPHAVNSLLDGNVLPADANVVSTTIDLPLQRLLERLVRQSVARGTGWGMKNAAALLVDWRSGEIRALAGSSDFFNAAIKGQVDGTAARRSPGSTLKPFVYALALDEGLIHPRTILADTPRRFHGYSPDNADGAFRGPISAEDALRASRNIPAITLANQLRTPGLYGFLRTHGVNFKENSDHYGLALVLGGAEVTMRELAALYATLPNHGLWREVSLLQGRREAVNAISPEAALITLDMLRAPTPSGFNTVPVAWKTGTSNGKRDAWTAGVAGAFVLVVWVGNFDGRPNPGFTGIHAAAPLFFDIVSALEGKGMLREKNGTVEKMNLVRIPVCAATGDVDVSLCTKDAPRSPGALSGTVDTWFIPGVSPIQPSGILRELVIDKETGLRQCAEIPGRTERVIWECWPGDVRRLFRQAGIVKPAPPPFAPECQSDSQPPQGRAPVITQPRAGVTYTASIRHPRAIPLLADLEADAESVHWFAGTKFLGKTTPETPLFWMPTPGVTTLRAVDSEGRAGTLNIIVESVP